MTTEFSLPELGEDIETGDVISVYVSAGDEVTKDQPVMEIETDKAAIEVPSPVSGVIKGVHVKEGETIRVGQLLLTIDDLGGEKEGVLVEEEAYEKEESIEPEVEDSEEEKEVEEKTEARIKGNDKEDDTKARDIAITRNEDEEGKVVEFTRSARSETRKEPAKDRVVASPSVRRLAREIGVDISQIKGSGPGGRIIEEDVKKFASEQLAGAQIKLVTQGEETIPLPDYTKWGEIERVSMSKVRRLTAERLSSSWRAPHVTQHDKADITELEKARKEFGKKVQEAGGKLTMTSIVIKVVGSALKIFPKFNSSIDMENSEIIYKKYYNIAVAVDTDRGLLVPVIKDVGKKNLIEISIELTEISEKARNKKIRVNELQGGTFTVSNLGGLGGTYFSPVISAPEVALLGISRANIEPVFMNEQFKPRLMLPFSLSYDHRIIDGADAVRFLRWIVEALEQPFKLMLEG